MQNIKTLTGLKDAFGRMPNGVVYQVEYNDYWKDLEDKGYIRTTLEAYSVSWEQLKAKATSDIAKYYKKQEKLKIAGVKMNVDDESEQRAVIDTIKEKLDVSLADALDKIENNMACVCHDETGDVDVTEVFENESDEPISEIKPDNCTGNKKQNKKKF